MQRHGTYFAGWFGKIRPMSIRCIDDHGCLCGGDGVDRCDLNAINSLHRGTSCGVRSLHETTFDNSCFGKSIQTIEFCVAFAPRLRRKPNHNSAHTQRRPFAQKGSREFSSRVDFFTKSAGFVHSAIWLDLNLIIQPDAFFQKDLAASRKFNAGCVVHAERRTRIPGKQGKNRKVCQAASPIADWERMTLYRSNYSGKGFP